VFEGAEGFVEVASFVRTHDPHQSTLLEHVTRYRARASTRLTMPISGNMDVRLAFTTTGSMIAK
jgi:hypothetical protein